jgi:spore coat protein JB
VDAERRQILDQLVSLEFTALELQLYLDTHPDDQRALADFNATVQEMAGVRELYESRYGPLLSYGFSSSPRSWQWIGEPWPWQM